MLPKYSRKNKFCPVETLCFVGTINHVNAVSNVNIVNPNASNILYHAHRVSDVSRVSYVE